MIKRLLRKAGCAAAVLIAAVLMAALALIYPFFRVNRPPPISDPEVLVADCQNLVKGKLDGELKFEDPNAGGGLIQAQWPPTIAGLRPRCVYVHDDRVTILVSTGGIGPSRGYVIPYLVGTNFTGLGRGRHVIDGSLMSKTKHRNIYYWSDIE